ncbi:MAG: hypothetical protein FJX59_08945 [Alphaproteobacteria bacterium]|nr:hypothetical protein [Alphaproteobacteria bacterium]
MAQAAHGVLAPTVHDEAARNAFVQSFRRHLAEEVLPGVPNAYRTRIEPAFVKAKGRAPQHRRELRPWMTADP